MPKFVLLANLNYGESLGVKNLVFLWTWMIIKGLDDHQMLGVCWCLVSKHLVCRLHIETRISGLQCLGGLKSKCFQEGEHDTVMTSIQSGVYVLGMIKVGDTFCISGLFQSKQSSFYLSNYAKVNTCGNESLNSCTFIGGSYD